MFIFADNDSEYRIVGRGGVIKVNNTKAPVENREGLIWYIG